VRQQVHILQQPSVANAVRAAIQLKLSALGPSPTQMSTSCAELSKNRAQLDGVGTLASARPLARDSFKPYETKRGLQASQKLQG